MLPLLLTALLGLIELGNTLVIQHKLVVLSREGASLASRDTPMAEALNVVMNSGDEIALTERGGAVVTRITVVDGAPVVDAQISYPGFEGASRLGGLNEVALPLQELNLPDEQVLYAVEVLYRYEPLTPIAGFVPGEWRDSLYERAIF